MIANNKIRVLHIITRLIPGGADENTIYTVEGLDKSLYIVDLLAGGQSDPQLLKNVDSVRVLVLPDLRRELNPVHDGRALVKIMRFVRQNRYHIVHTHTAKAGIIGRLAAFLAGAPKIVHTLHGTTFHDSLGPGVAGLYRQLERVAARVTDLFIAVGEELVDCYVTARVARRERFVTIRSAFDLGKFTLSEKTLALRRVSERRKLGLEENVPLIGTVSRIEPRKGHEYFVAAAAQLLKSHPQMQFVIAGDGFHLGAMRSLVSELDLESHVHFLGHRTDIENVLASLDVFVLTSLWEGLPRVLVQAAAAGCPSVTFDVEGAREIVEEGVNGFVVPKRDVTMLAERIDFLVSNRAKAKSIGRAGRTKVTADWNVQAMVQKISDIYTSLLRNSS